MFLIQAAVPHIGAGGSIVNISSVVTKAPIPAPYQTASKLALEGYAVTLARELAARGIRINTVSAGYTETDMLKSGGEALLAMGAAASIFNRLGKSIALRVVVGLIVWYQALSRTLREWSLSWWIRSRLVGSSVKTSARQEGSLCCREVVVTQLMCSNKRMQLRRIYLAYDTILVFRFLHH